MVSAVTGTEGWRQGQRSGEMYLQQVEQRVFPGLGKELLLDADQWSFSETLQTDHHPCYHGAQIGDIRTHGGHLITDDQGAT